MSLHNEYFDLVKHFSLNRRMENLPTSETLICSLQRQLGLTPNNNEKEVWQNDDLYSLVFDDESAKDISKIFREELSSPVSQKGAREQKIKSEKFEFREYIKPLIPDVAGYTHGARSGAVGTPWNPGKWLLEELALAFNEFDEYEKFINELADAFDVKPDDGHPLATFLINSIPNREYSIKSQILNDSFYKTDKKSLFGWKSAEVHLQFVNLIRYVLKCKKQYSRYRWILFLDAVLRLFATVSSIWRFKTTVIFMDRLKNKQDLLVFESPGHLIGYGDTRVNIVRKGIQEYIVNYLQIHFLCKKLNIDPLRFTTEDLFRHLSNNVNSDMIQQSEKDAVQVARANKSEFELRTSTLKNSKEFLEYVGVKKEDYEHKTVDYTFHYNKIGRDYKFAFGDSLLLILVKYSGQVLNNNQFTSSDFVKVISGLGIKINISEFSLGSLGENLLKLGVIEEISDSDSGMIFRTI